MRSAGNRGFLQGSLQVLHIHVLFVAPLGTGHMTQPGTDQHKGGVSIRETSHYTSSAANLPVQSLNNVVGSNTSPVFWWKIAVSQSFLNAVFYLFSGLFQLHRT